MSIGKRLKEERDRIPMNQSDFAAVGGKSKKTLIDYEKDKTAPTARFLLAIAHKGVDLNYVFKGERSLNAVNEKATEYNAELQAEQQQILNNLALCSAEDYQAIKRLAAYAARAEQEKTKTVKPPQQTTHHHD